MKFGDIHNLCQRISCRVLGIEFFLRVAKDVKQPIGGRTFIQFYFVAPCSQSGNTKEYCGRKWYLSDHMTADEIIKTAYAAFEMVVKHEVMEGFKVDNITLFNPHTNFEVLLEASGMEIYRH